MKFSLATQVMGRTVAAAIDTDVTAGKEKCFERFVMWTTLSCNSVLNSLLLFTAVSQCNSYSLRSPGQQVPCYSIVCQWVWRPLWQLYLCHMLSWPWKGFASSLCNLLHSPVTSSLPGTNILNTMFSNTLSFLSSHNVNNQVSHPYKTTGKILVLYILIFKFFNSNLEDERFCAEW